MSNSFVKSTIAENPKWKRDNEMSKARTAIAAVCCVYTGNNTYEPWPLPNNMGNEIVQKDGIVQKINKPILVCGYAYNQCEIQRMESPQNITIKIWRMCRVHKILQFVLINKILFWIGSVMLIDRELICWLLTELLNKMTKTLEISQKGATLSKSAKKKI